MKSKNKIVETASPLRAWYLTTFRGLSVRAVRVRPFVTMMGGLAYSRCWVLVSDVHLPTTLTQL